MAVTSSLAAKRSLSLDISAASKANDDRNTVWTTENNSEQNGTPNSAKLTNTVSSPGTHKPPHYTRKKIKTKRLPKVESSGKNGQLKSQTSELYQTWCQKFLSWRYFMVFLLQSSFVVVIFLRNCLPMAMVCMIRPSISSLSPSNGSYESSNRTVNEVDHNVARNGHYELDPENVSFIYNKTRWQDKDYYEFDWNAEDQGLVLTSIMFSSFVGPLMASMIKERLGSKHTLSLLNLVSAALTFLSPVAARISPYCLVVVRILQGISLGGNVAVIGDCVAWWAPQDEKLTMIALAFTGVNIGSILASFVSGYLCLVPLDNGWPFVFYVFGSLSLIWNILWHFMSAQKPEEHRYISEKEKQYIISHRSGLDSQSGGKIVKTPYRKMMSSAPVLAYFVAISCHVWATTVLFTYLPVFFYNYLKFSVQETGLLTSLTSTFRMLGTFFWTALGNKLVSSVGTKRSRKICICTGFGVAGVTTIFVGFFDESYKWIVLSLLIFVMINQSVGSSTLTALPLDMAPRYAGLLTGMFLSLGSFIGLSGPLLTAAITANGTQEEWRTVWLIMGFVFITGAVIFLPFGQASLQPWAQGKDTDAPHIVSPFVTMGRRFSTLLEAPPLSPVTPMKNGFDFSQKYGARATNMLAQLASATPEIFYTGTLDTGKSTVSEVIVEATNETEESYTEEGDDDTSDDHSLEDNIETQANPARKRAYSESALEHLRSNVSDTAEGFDREHGYLSKPFKRVEESSTGYAKDASLQASTSGNVNEGFEALEDKPNLHSDDVHVSHL